jgi:hypothetical protein
MSREINSTQPFQDKVVKLIPTEIVGAYMVLNGIIGLPASPAAGSVRALSASPVSEETLKVYLVQAVFAILLVLTPFYLAKVAKVTNRRQLVATTMSFVIWAYTLGGPFVVWGLYYPIVASVLLVIWSLFVPMFVPAAESAEQPAKGV